MTSKAQAEDALRNLSLADLRVDPAGRVFIDNPKVAEILKDAEIGRGGGEAAWNVGCSNTGCGGEQLEQLRDEIMSVFRRRTAG